MAILLPTSSFKTSATLFMAGVISVVAAVTFTVPSVSHFAVSCFPAIYENTVFLLKPPYLYLLINCIIVSILATSKLTHKSSPIDDFSQVINPVTTVPVPTGYLNVASDYTGFVDINTPVVEDAPQVIAVDDDLRLNNGQDHKTETEMLKPATDSPKKLKPISSHSPALKQSRKPPRFGQQKSLKINSQGGGSNKTALGVTKPPRKEDTLESTWKKITEGRSTPLTKHLTKSDTWQERTHVQTSSDKMTKSENFHDINAPTHQTLLNREPSPGQEELNRRVEAFIKKFNEEMRLQRLESLAKYNQTLNEGTRL